MRSANHDNSVVRKRPMTKISTHCALRRAAAAVVLAGSFMASSAAAQTACNGPLRKVNVGV
jgi:hypothetical protein